jgi:peptide/nickel transport system substrate-binding protein
MGLAPMSPVVDGTLTANMVNLVYAEPLSAYVDRKSVEGSTIRFHIRDGLAVPSAELAADFEHPDRAAAVVEGQDLVVRFAHEATAQAVTLDEHLIAIGPYDVASSREGALALVRVAPDSDGPARIEAVAVPTEEEEWRRLIAGEYDLATSISPGTVRYLEEMPDLRMVRFERPQSAALWFNAGRGPAADERVRRAVSLATRRKPLAQNVLDSAAAAADVQEDLDEARRLLHEIGYSSEHPLVLRLTVNQGQSDLVRAALVLEQQLASVDIVLDVSVMPVPDMVKRLLSKEYEAVLFYGDWSERYRSNMLSTSEANYYDYRSAAFDAAMAANDERAVLDVLAREVPLTPLFELNESVVVRRKYCNVHPKVLGDFSWLADVRPCAAGEAE